MPKSKIPWPHPGEILKLEFMEPMGLSANQLGHDLDVPPNRIAQICNGQRSITADTALRLARYFGMSPEFWMGLQLDYDLRTVKETAGAIIEKKIKPRKMVGA